MAQGVAAAQVAPTSVAVARLDPLDQHGNVRATQHLARDASEEDPLQHVVAAVADHQEVGRGLLRPRSDRRADIAGGGNLDVDLKRARAKRLGERLEGLAIAGIVAEAGALRVAHLHEMDERHALDAPGSEVGRAVEKGDLRVEIDRDHGVVEHGFSVVDWVSAGFIRPRSGLAPVGSSADQGTTNTRLA